MIPIVAALAQWGLPLLGNAIMAKGKDVIEEKLGVNIEEMIGTPEGRIKLKELEYSNEEMLRQFTLATREQELRSDKMYLDDVDSARKMQIAALGQEDVFSKRFIYWFAIVWSVFTAIYIGFITFGSIPAANIRFADTILGFLLGSVLGVMFQFFYGSSKNNQNKDETIKQVIGRIK